MLRTHTCGELRHTDDGKTVVLCGWMQSRRDHASKIFIDLRDRYGLTQLVFDSETHKAVHEQGEKFRREDVLQVTGKVILRGKGLENSKLETGKIEVVVTEVKLLSKAETPPIEVDDHKVAGMDTRLKYRYIDLRRPSMQHNLRVRHNIKQAAREYLSKNGFLEVETPLLIKSTPEGARDFVVPSRLHPGKFYSLPQSPQLYKQILMYSGVDRYFQLAFCFRDEDLREDRQPEHTQIDLEMSFCELDDLWTMWEGLMKACFDAAGKKVQTPFRRISYSESMERYGVDKPDLRFGMELINVTDAVKGCEFGVFNSILQHGGIIKALNPSVDLSRKKIDALTKWCAQFGSKGLAWMKVTDKGLESNIVKYFPDKVQQNIIKVTGAKPGSTLLFVADKEKVVHDVLWRLRVRLGKELELYKKDELSFCWVIDFPLFEWDDETEKWEMAHHMFCQPKAEHLKYIKSDPGKVICTQYDLTLNGFELGSGSLRITDAKLQEQIMKVVGYTKEEAIERFGFLLEAFKYGCPPHGGIGLGFDRIVCLALGMETPDIREVIAFPKTKAMECPMDGSPSNLPSDQLKELSLKLNLPKKEK